MTNENQILYLTRGIPASGKDTFAQEWVAESPGWRVRVNRDDLRFETYGTYHFEGPKDVVQHMEETMTLLETAKVEAALKAKLSVVVSDTNLTHKFAKEWLRLAKKLGVKAEFVDFNVPLDEALRRNQKRGDEGGRFVPEDVIRSFYQRFVNKKTGLLNPYPVLDPTFESVVRKYTRPDWRENKRKVVLVDIDGTLADMAPCGRGPFEWHRVGEDAPIENVIEIVSALHVQGYRIVFMSGRDEVCREETESWLAEHLIDFRDNPQAELHMRPEGDMRKDSEVKAELFWKNVGEKYDVVMVFDDRAQVVEMWRDMGLTVAQVAPGDF